VRVCGLRNEAELRAPSERELNVLRPALRLPLSGVLPPTFAVPTFAVRAVADRLPRLPGERATLPREVGRADERDTARPALT
jgi:hypothetical protein